MDADARRSRNLANVLQAFEGIAAGDAAAMLQGYRDDFVLELPYGTTTEPVVVEGKEAVLAYLTRAFETFRFSLELTEQHEAADPNQLILEYVSVGTVLTTGKPYRNRYIALYWFDDDGRVKRVREFYNTAAALEATTPD